MTLSWYRRPDGLWNADCACGATLCGFPGDEALLAEGERWHFARADEDRAAGRKHKPCGKAAPNIHPQYLPPEGLVLWPGAKP